MADSDSPVTVRLNQLECLVLLALARLGEEANAGNVRADVTESGRRAPSVAGTYAALERLVAARLARVWLSDPRPEPGGRARRHYAITPAGLTWLRDERARVETAWRDVTTKGRRLR